MLNEFKNEKVAIVGVDSFTGRHLYSAIRGDFESVIGTSKASGNKWFYVDLLNRRSIEEFLVNEKPDVIVLLAAISQTTDVPQQKYFDVNYSGIINFIKATKNVKANYNKIIYASTAHIYGFTESHCIDEKSPASVSSYYAFSKLASEEALRMNFPDNLVVVRPFNYTGLGQSIKFLIPKLVSHFATQSKFVQLGNLYPTRDYNDVRNVCSIYRNILLSEIGSETLNICSGVGTTIAEILTTLEEISGHTMEVEVNSALVRNGEPRVQVGSVSKLKELGLYNYTHSIRDTLHDLYQEQIKNVGN